LIFGLETMTFEDIISRILSERPELTRKKVLELIEAKERNARGFLTRESAALSLAADLGVAMDETYFRRELQIKDLVSGLGNVTVSGRVIYVSPLKRFTRPDGREGARRSIHIADKTGMIKAILWDDKALSPDLECLLDKIIRLSHVSVKRKRGGRLELNVGSRGKIEIEPKDLKNEDYPPLTKFTKKISEITSDEKDVSVIGLIKQVYPLVTFKRQDGSEGKVRRVKLEDETGEVILVLWDDKADLISEDHVGKYVMLTKVKIKQRFDGWIELQTKDRTEISFLEKKPSGFRL